LLHGTMWAVGHARILQEVFGHHLWTTARSAMDLQSAV
jgi:hypothetical protein